MLLGELINNSNSLCFLYMYYLIKHKSKAVSNGCGGEQPTVTERAGGSAHSPGSRCWESRIGAEESRGKESQGGFRCASR